MKKLLIGVELEFFTKLPSTNNYVSSHKYTSDLDGNPFIGEIRTKPYDDVVDLIFNLKKRIYLMEAELSKKGVVGDFVASAIQLSDEQLKELRADKSFANRKDSEALIEYSIYPKGKLGKLLKRGLLKTSLQLNFSVSEDRDFGYVDENKKHQKFEYCQSDVFNYVKIIETLDNAFTEEIKNSQRVKGVYAIKDGKKGKRIEYRSLPSNVDLDKLLDVLKTIKI